MWAPQLKVLEQNFRVLRYDTRGHGGSALGEIPFAMTDLVEDVLYLWDKLEIEQSHFLGLSLGGMTGIGVALHCPDRVLRLVACDCRLDAPVFFQEMWDQRIAVIESGGLEALVDAVIDTWLCPATREREPGVEKLARQLILETPAKSYVACARALQGLDFKRRLDEVAVPVLYLVGEHDGPHPTEMTELASLTPGALLQVLPDASHLSNLEQHAAFNAALLDFLLTS